MGWRQLRTLQINYINFIALQGYDDYYLRPPYLQPLLLQNTVPVYGAYLGGESVHHLQLPQQGGFLVLSKTANGISAELTTFISRKINIPAFGGVKSLNAGIAAAIICDNLTRLSTMR